VESEIRVRISKNTLYIPKAIAKAAGIKNGSIVKMRIKD